MDVTLLKLLENLIQSAIDHGPGMIIALIILYGLYKLFKDVGLKIAGSAKQMADAVNVQTESMKRLGSSVEEYVSRDQMEHKEMILLLKVISSKVSRIEEGEDGTQKRAVS